VRALMLSVATRADDAAACRIATAQWIGAGAVAATRLRRLLAPADEGIAAIVAVLRLHPAFLTPYLRIDVQATAADRARIAIGDCDALHEGDAYSWYALLDAAPHPALDAMVQAVDSRARCVSATPSGDERLAWEIVVDPAAAPAPMPSEAAMVAATGTATFTFRS